MEWGEQKDAENSERRKRSVNKRINVGKNQSRKEDEVITIG